MKKIFLVASAIFLLILSTAAQTNIFPSTGSAGIGTLTPNASSALEIKSTTQGLLIPRMTLAKRDAIVSPATGLMIYQTNNTPGFYYYDGAAWTAMSTTGANTKLSNLAAPIAINVDLLAGANNKRSLGSSLLGWKDIYLTGSVYSNGNRFISTDASSTWVGLNAGVFNTGNYNNALGYSALASNTSGSANVAVGFTALTANTTGSNNIAIGQASMHANISGGGNVAAGFGALYSNGTGSFNNAYGHYALFNNTTGYSNVAIGNGALYSNTTGHNLVAVGDSALYNQSTSGNESYFNTAVGTKALFNNTTGSSNTANGSLALYSNTTGFYNTANGFWGLNHNTTGNYNTANGSHVLYLNTTGNYNTGNGFAALYNNITGTFNTANGSEALSSNTTGNSNTANGNYSLSENKTGNTNTANGDYSLANNTTGHSNIAIGAHALYKNTNRSNLVAIGDSALFNNGSGATQDAHATANTAVGSKALYTNTSGSYSVATGAQSLYSNTVGSGNTASGYQALYSNTSGDQNTAIGLGALYFNSTGSYNSAFGLHSLSFNTFGSYNTATGINALESNTEGNYNTADGYQALISNVKGNNNTALGFGADVSFSTTNATVIGNMAVVDASDKVRIGNNAVTSIGGQVSWTTFSDGRYKKNIKQDVKGLAFINSLRPITYTVDINSLNEYFDKGRKHDSAYARIKADMQPSADEAAAIVYNGFIAQDVEASAKKLNYNFSGVDKPKTNDGLYGLRYSDFVVPLVKAVQELSKQNDSLKQTVASQQLAISNQQKINSDLQKQFNDLKNLVLSIQQCSPCNTSGATTQTYNTTITDAAGLQQNVPNPFTNSTSIAYTLPQKFTTAQMMITDKNGKTLKLVNVSGAGKGKLNVDASTLASGAYNYSLLVDGKLIGTKQMVLTK